MDCGREINMPIEVLKNLIEVLKILSYPEITLQSDCFISGRN